MGDASIQHRAGSAFLNMHVDRTGFIMPNAWDCGSAIVLAHQGFKAIATTSAGIAFSMGKQDYDVRDARFGVSRDQMMARAGEIARAVGVPVNGDLEAGYGDSPEEVALTVRMAIEAGLAGGNIEDKVPGRNALYDETLAQERIIAAREAIGAKKTAFVLTARTDGLSLSPPAGLATCIRRANLLHDAGADCLFIPGVADPTTIALLVQEIDAPLNVVMGLLNAEGDTRSILAAGARRVSLGGSIARAALAFVQRAAEELRNQGSITFASEQLSGNYLNVLFAESNSFATHRR